MKKITLIISFIWSTTLLFGQSLLDMSKIDSVYVFDMDTTHTQNATAYISYYNSPDSCINLFQSHNVNDYDTMFLSEREDMVIFRYEKSRLLINYSTHNSEVHVCKGMLLGISDGKSFIIYHSTTADPNKKCQKSIVLFDCEVNYSSIFFSDGRMEKERLEIKKLIGE